VSLPDRNQPRDGAMLPIRARGSLGPPLHPIRLDGSLSGQRRVGMSLCPADARAPTRGALLLVVPLDRPRAGVRQRGIHHRQINGQHDEEREEQQSTHRLHSIRRARRTRRARASVAEQGLAQLRRDFRPCARDVGRTRSTSVTRRRSTSTTTSRTSLAASGAFDYIREPRTNGGLVGMVAFDRIQNRREAPSTQRLPSGKPAANWILPWR